MFQYSSWFDLPPAYPVHIFYQNASLDGIQVTTPGEYQIKGNTSSFMQTASDNHFDYVGYCYGPVSFFIPESGFYHSTVDLYPFVPQAVTLQVAPDNYGGLDGRLAFTGTPEPSSILLFLVMLLGLLRRRK